MTKQQKRLAKAEEEKAAAIAELRKVLPIGSRVWFVTVRETKSCNYFRVLTGDKTGVHDITIDVARATRYTMRRIYGRFAIDADQWQALCYHLSAVIHTDDLRIKNPHLAKRYGKRLGELRAAVAELEKTHSITSTDRATLRAYQNGYTLRGESL